MNLAFRAFFHIPVVGWLAKDAVRGAPDAKFFFMANVMFAIAVSVYEFGYPLLILLALTATGLAFAFLITLTASDLFDAKSRALVRDRARVGA